MRSALIIGIVAVLVGAALLPAALAWRNRLTTEALALSADPEPQREREPPLELGDALLGLRPVEATDLPDRWQELDPAAVADQLPALLDSAHDQFRRRLFDEAAEEYREARLGALYAQDQRTALHALTFFIAATKWYDHYEQYWQVLQIAAAEAAELDDPVVQAETAQVHAEFFSDLHLWREAAEYYLSAIEGYHSGGDQDRWLDSVSEASEVMFDDAGMIEEAQELCDVFTAQVLANSRRDSQQVSALIAAAVFQRRAQDYEAALELLNQARQLAGELGDDAGRAGALRSLAHTWWGIGEVFRGITCYRGYGVVAANSPEVDYDHWSDAYLAEMLLAVGDDAAALETQQRAWEHALAADDWPSQFQRHLAEFAEHARWPAYMRSVVCGEEGSSQTAWFSTPAERQPPHGVTPGMTDLAVRCFAYTGEAEKARDLLDFIRAGNQQTGIWMVGDVTLSEAEVLVLQAEGKHEQAAKLQREVVETWRGYGALHYETGKLYLLAELEAEAGSLEHAVEIAAEAWQLDTSLVSELYYGSVLLHYGMQDFEQEWPAYASLLEAAGQYEQAQQVQQSLTAARRLRSELLAGFPNLSPAMRELLTSYRRLQSERRRILDEYFSYPHSTDSHREYLRTHYYAPAEFIELFDTEHAAIQAEMHKRAELLADQAAAVLGELAELDPQLGALIRLEPPADETVRPAGDDAAAE